jgi:hypothetical protein
VLLAEGGEMVAGRPEVRGIALAGRMDVQAVSAWGQLRDLEANQGRTALPLDDRRRADLLPLGLYRPARAGVASCPQARGRVRAP